MKVLSRCVLPFNKYAVFLGTVWFISSDELNQQNFMLSIVNRTGVSIQSISFKKHFSRIVRVIIAQVFIFLRPSVKIECHNKHIGYYAHTIDISTKNDNYWQLWFVDTVLVFVNLYDFTLMPVRLFRFH